MVISHLAGPTGFEPAISSVTGRRDRPTSLRAQVWRFTYDTSFSPLIQAVVDLFIGGQMVQLIRRMGAYAAVAQLVERRFRKA